MDNFHGVSVKVDNCCAIIARYKVSKRGSVVNRASGFQGRGEKGVNSRTGRSVERYMRGARFNPAGSSVCALENVDNQRTLEILGR